MIVLNGNRYYPMQYSAYRFCLLKFIFRVIKTIKLKLETALILNGPVIIMQETIWQVIKSKKERLALFVYSVVLYTGAAGPTRGGNL